MGSESRIAVIQDRYSGAYSGGAWLAIAGATVLLDDRVTRLQFCLAENNGPSDGDVEAAAFWKYPPDWIAVGRTPDGAVEALRKALSASEPQPMKNKFEIHRIVPE